MRGWLVVLALSVVACKGNKDNKDKGTAKQPAAKAALAISEVKSANLLAAETKEPPFVLLLDAAGKLHVNVIASWADLATKDLMAGAKTADPREIDMIIRETLGLGRTPKQGFADWDPSDIGIDLTSLEDEARKHGLDQDDPPPPEEEDRPDDGAEESGGTGTAMALEEGKMGKKDSDRAEGQYKMQKNQEDPLLARQQAAEQAAAVAAAKRGPIGLGPHEPNQFGTPSRVADVVGEVMRDGKLDPLRSILIAPPKTPASKVIEIVAWMQPAIAVIHAGRVRPLRLQFNGRAGYGDGPSHWIEARVTTTGVTVEAVPDVPVEVAKLDALGAAIDKARAARVIDSDAPVDLLVASDVDTQRLVDVLVALDMANVRLIGLGNAPGAEELKRRGHRIPTVALGAPSANGDLDKALIRRYVKSNLNKIQACYDKLLATEPDAAGTVTVGFFISPKGTVTKAAGSGVNPALADCVAGVVKTIVFPAPKGGGVDVTYPFTFRP